MAHQEQLVRASTASLGAEQQACQFLSKSLAMGSAQAARFPTRPTPPFLHELCFFTRISLSSSPPGARSGARRASSRSPWRAKARESTQG